MKKIMLSVFYLWVILGLHNLCLAPVSEFSKIEKLIIDSCYTNCINFEKVFILFKDESGLKNIWTKEKKYKHRVIAHGVPQLLYKTALSREVGYKGKESNLDKNEVAIPLAVKYLAHLSKCYHGNWSKIISHYKSGSPNHSRFWRRLYPKYVLLSGDK